MEGKILYSRLNVAVEVFVVQVYDGDTVKVVKRNGEIIYLRLWGIDAPEKGQPGFRRAKQRLKQILASRSWMCFDMGADRYNRRVVKILSLPDFKEDVSYLMVSEGWAWWYRQFSKGDTSLRFAELQARRLKLGIFSIYGVVPPWFFRNKKKYQGRTFPESEEGA